MTPRAWVKALRAQLAARGDPARAEQMQAYMKSALPFYGVPKPVLRRVTRALPPPSLASLAELEAFLHEVYGRATHREERYAALTILASRAAKPWRTVEARALYEWLIVEGAWWDLVDEVATLRVAEWFALDAPGAGRILRAWSRGESMWLRRAAIIAQVGRKDLELALLFEVIEPALGEKEFFLRKAIGWALRAAAARRPVEVRAYVEAQRARLSGLSLREAEKGLRRAGVGRQGSASA